MSETDYKQKYLKYKNKYIVLKKLELQNQQKQLQTGGYAYNYGKYLFFIPKNYSLVIDASKQSHGNIIPSLDTFTSSLGNCTRYLKIDDTTNYIYTNQNTMNASSQAATRVATQAATQAYDASSKLATQAYDASSKAANQVYDASSKAATQAYDASSKAVTQAVTQAATQASQAVSSHLTPKSIVGGADEDCDKSPIQLPNSDYKIKLIDDNDNISKITKLVELINDKQQSSPIYRVIIIDKTGTFGKVILYHDYVITYDEKQNLTSLTEQEIITK